MKLRNLALLVLSVFVFTACGGNDSGSITSDPATTTISAETGGTLVLSDGTSLSVPPGALENDTEITIRVDQEATQENNGYAIITLEPEGLQFSSPALLTIPYEAEAVGEGNIVVVYTYSSSIPEFDAGSEISQWEQLPITNDDNSQVTVELNHFSTVVTDPQKILHTILHIPGRFLKKSDLLYTLTYAGYDENFDWFPGHVGMFLGTDTAEDTTNDEQTIIEAVREEGVTITNLEEDYPYDLSHFMDIYYHLYMGARTYNGSLNDEDRKTIAGFAIEQEGDSYSLIGIGNGQGIDFYSCVGLTEASYEEAGKGIVPFQSQFPLLPSSQFKRTVPVAEITYDLSKDEGGIQVDVHGVLKVPSYSFFYHYVSSADNPEDVSVSDSNLVDTMTFEDNRFEWNNPKPGTYVVDFTSTGTFKGEEHEETQSLTINVTGEGDPVNLAPVADVTYVSGNEIVYDCEGVVDPPEVYTLNGSNSYDPDGDQLFYVWSISPTPDSFSGEHTSDFTFTISSVSLIQDYMVTLTVSDGQLENSSLYPVVVMGESSLMTCPGSMF